MLTKAPTVPSNPTYRVHIIESPSDEDLLHGRQDREPLRHMLGQTGIEARVYVPINQKRLMEALVKIAMSHEMGTTPIVHISAHGNEHAIGLSNGEMCGWDLLGRALKLVNQAVGGGLILCMSTCEGLAALKMVTTKFDAPFHMVIGPRTRVEWRDALVAFVAFYHQLIRHGARPEDAAQAMNVAAGVPLDTFYAIPAQVARDLHAAREQEEQKRILAEAAQKLMELFNSRQG